LSLDVQVRFVADNHNGNPISSLGSNQQKRCKAAFKAVRLHATYEVVQDFVTDDLDHLE
jgi:hypothetical protein